MLDYENKCCLNGWDCGCQHTLYVHAAMGFWVVGIDVATVNQNELKIKASWQTFYS